MFWEQTDSEFGITLVYFVTLNEVQNCMFLDPGKNALAKMIYF